MIQLFQLWTWLFYVLTMHITYLTFWSMVTAKLPTNQLVNYQKKHKKINNIKELR